MHWVQHLSQSFTFGQVFEEFNICEIAGAFVALLQFRFSLYFLVLLRLLFCTMFTDIAERLIMALTRPPSPVQTGLEDTLETPLKTKLSASDKSEQRNENRGIDWFECRLHEHACMAWYNLAAVPLSDRTPKS